MSNGRYEAKARLALVLPTEPGLSETFLAAHVQRLAGIVGIVTHQPIVRVDGVPVEGRSVLQRCERRIRRWRPGANTQLTHTFIKALRRLRPDVVLAEYGPTAVKVLDACVELDIPLAAHFHGYDASRDAIIQQYQNDYRRLFDYASAVIAVSRDMQQRLIALGAPASKVVYNPYGVEIPELPAKPATAPPTFLAVGRFVEKKAPHLTLHAMKLVLDQVPEARLRMIGDGPLLGTCQDIAQALAIDHAVTFLGACPHEQVFAEMQSARAFVQHSVVSRDGNSEGTPNSVLEASAAGLPVVATRHAGISDVIADNGTGFLVVERDVQGMAARMISLAQEPALAGELGYTGRKRAEREFRMPERIASLQEVLDRCHADRTNSTSVRREVVAATTDLRTR